MHIPNFPTAAIKPFFLTLLVAVSGCAFFPYKVDVSKTGTPRYDVLEVKYELESGEGALSSKAFRPDEGVNVAGYSGWPSPKKQNYSAANLQIEFPHPDRNRKFARVTLRLAGESNVTTKKRRGLVSRMSSGIKRISWRDDETKNRSKAAQVVRSLDLPKAELDLLLFDLADSGFFDGQQRRAGGSQLSIRINRGQTAHPWGSEPRLDDLIVRVYREGTDAEPSEK